MHDIYFEKKIDKTLYRVSVAHNGKTDLKKTLEDLTVRKILQHFKVKKYDEGGVHDEAKNI